MYQTIKPSSNLRILGITGLVNVDRERYACNSADHEIRRVIAATMAKMIPDASAIDAPEGRLP